MDTQDIKLYSRSKYMRPTLHLREYSSLFSVSLVGSGALKALGGTHLFWLAFAIFALIISYLITWKL